MTSRFHAGTLQSSNILFLKNCIRRGEDEETKRRPIINKIVTLMRREKQTNTSLVYVSTQKQRHKLNILRTLKLAACMNIKYSNTILYNNLHLDQK